MMWLLHGFRNASVGVKVALAPALGVVFLVVLGALGLQSSARMQGMLSDLASERLPAVLRVAELERAMVRLNGEVYHSVALEGAGYKAEKIEALDKDITAELGRVDTQLKALLAGPASAGQREHLAQVAREYAKFRKNALDALDAKTGMPANAVGFIATMGDSYARMQVHFNEAVRDETTLVAAAAADGQAIVTQYRWLIVLGVGVSVVLALAITATSVRGIVRPLQEAVRQAEAMSSGDFRAPPQAHSRDATGQVLAALAKVSRNLGGMVAGIRQAADEVRQASHALSGSNQALSQRTESTVSSLQQTAATLDQLSVTIRQSADGAAQANGLAREARAVAHEGGTVVAEVIATMQQIDTQAKKIRDIIGVIDGIAFQTNILALNAAVEAARAGEQGRGFAVVAQEVRSLAGRSADAAREVRSLIGASVEQVDSGTAKVQAAGETMRRLVASVEHVTTTVEAIAQAATEQALGVAQVNTAIAEMDRDAQQNATMVDSAAHATEALRGQAEQLAQSVATLKTTG